MGERLLHRECWWSSGLQGAVELLELVWRHGGSFLSKAVSWFRGRAVGTDLGFIPQLLDLLAEDLEQALFLIGKIPTDYTGSMHIKCLA